MERIWIRGVNWLGDSVMTLPALAAFRAAHPGVRIGLGAPAGLIPFWRLCPVVDDLFALEKGLGAEWRMACAIRAWRPDRIVIFPNSFRSAWVPFLSGVGERIGAAGRLRRFLLSRVVPQSRQGHQALDYFDLLELPRPPALPQVRGLVAVSSQWRERTIEKVRREAGRDSGFPHPEERGWLAVLPGAARGESKRWPAERFAAVAARIAAERRLAVVVCGSSEEESLCRRVVDMIPGSAVSVAGRTDVAELAAVLEVCRAVLCNDSGGMHLAAAVGTPVVAVFGATDPARTGPLGFGHRVLTVPGVRRSESVARRSEAARIALEAVTAEMVVAALEGLFRSLGKE